MEVLLACALARRQRRLHTSRPLWQHPLCCCGRRSFLWSFLALACLHSRARPASSAQLRFWQKKSKRVSPQLRVGQISADAPRSRLMMGGRRGSTGRWHLAATGTPRSEPPKSRTSASKVARCVLSGYESVPAGPAIAALVARNGCTASGFAAGAPAGPLKSCPGMSGGDHVRVARRKVRTASP